MTSRDDAQEALFASIAKLTADLEKNFGANTNDLMNHTSSLRNLALAYRYVDGGSQPGALTSK